jgi:sphinganine C4-monooxygenase
MPTRDAPMSGKSSFVGLVLCKTFSHIQGLQTLLGLALGALGEGDVTGSEDFDLAIWISRVHAAFAAIPSLLSLTGIDFKTMAITRSRSGPFLPTIGHPEFDMPSIEVLTGRLLYWYIVPIFQLASALIVADACMYCLHRLGHTNKWIYSKSWELHRKDI